MLSFACVTLSFNQGKYLPFAIDSVLSQGEEIDYLVYDAGSEDDSREVINRYINRGVRNYYIDGDRGPSQGLNISLKEVSGDIFYYLNADDVVLPGAFRYAKEYFSNHPECDVLHGSIHIIDENGKVRRKLPAMKFSIKGMILGRSVVYQQATFIRKSVLPANPFNEENRVSWDGELIFDLAIAGARIHKTQMILGQFRIYPETITGSGHYVEEANRQRLRMATKYLGRKPNLIERSASKFLKILFAILRRIRPRIMKLTDH